MNEQELDLTLGAIVQSRTQVTAPPILRQHVRAVPCQTPEQRSWLLRPTTWMFRSTFSATRFVIAGAIVALFGGFLLAGVLTQPSEDRLPVVGSSASATTQADPTVAATNRPEPTTAVKADRTIATLDLLPGVDLITEQVEPGAYRVLSDGTDNDLDFSASDRGGFFGTELIAGQDGSVWLVDDSRLLRLGTEGWVDPRRLDMRSPDITVAPDGTLWARGPDPEGGTRQVWSLASGAWTEWATGMDLPIHRGIADIGVTADGTVWATLLVDWAADNCSMNPANVYGGGRLAVARLGDHGWVEEPIEATTTAEWAELVMGPDGPEFLIAGPCSPDGQRLLERTADGWVDASVPGADRVAQWSSFWPVEIGPDGTVWISTNFEVDVEDDRWLEASRLLRRTDGDWEVFGEKEPVPMVVADQMWASTMTVSADGKLWLTLGGNAIDGAGGGVTALEVHRESGHSVVSAIDGRCPGLLSFDGASWTHHLAGACVTHLSAAPNGNVWAMVEELDPARSEGGSTDSDSVPAGLYVLTPEAVSADD